MLLNIVVLPEFGFPARAIVILFFVHGSNFSHYPMLKSINAYKTKNCRLMIEGILLIL